MAKEYLFKSVEDIAEIGSRLSDKELDDMFIDMKTWVKIYKQHKKSILSKILQFDIKKFIWINDKKHDKFVRIKLL